MFFNRKQNGPPLLALYVPYQLQINTFLHGFGDGAIIRREPILSIWLVAESIAGTKDQKSIKLSLN